MNDFPSRVDLTELETEGPSPVTWVENQGCTDVIVKGLTVACLEKRPHYCDRGHYTIKCFLPGIDESDSFPRYYMSRKVAVSETEAFINWRLWKIRGDANDGEKSNKG